MKNFDYGFAVGDGFEPFLEVVSVSRRETARAQELLACPSYKLFQVLVLLVVLPIVIVRQHTTSCIYSL